MATRRPPSPDNRLNYKRRRTDSKAEIDSESELEELHHEESRLTPMSRNTKEDMRAPSGLQPKALIIHQVLCSRTASSHTHHLPMASFLDEPRLYAGDNKTHSLRGQRPIRDIQSYREDNPSISFVVERYYDCMEYHESPEVSSQFERLVAPSSHAKIPNQVRPYLSVLASETKAAVPTRENITLISSGLIDAMEAARQISHNRAQRQPSALLTNWDNAENLDAPYLQLYHARHFLEACRQELNPKDGQQIGVLLDYLCVSSGGAYEEADSLFKQGYFTEAHFHKLFGPGDVLVIHQNGHDVALMVTDCPRPNVLPIRLNCETWSFDGAFHKGTQNVMAQLPAGCEMDKKMSISSLAVIPLRFDRTGLEEKLRQRGEYFWKCRSGRLVTSTGPKRGYDIQVSNPRYMIDMETYNALHGEEDEVRNQADNLPWRGDLTLEEMRSESPPSGHFVLLLPPTIKAFRFHDKKWKTLAVEHLRDINWDTEAFKKLVFDKQKKKLIQALVMNHVVNSSSADIIESKGNGLIILLHGPPGTGKTLTAESVAEFSKRPLYRLTSGDIGTDPEIVEKSLEHIFYLGNIWKAVVLLDECEVFMEERVPTDLKRNALVSVFLRALEYYDGILILTSNRVGTFDEAFKSRMHLAMYYPTLEQDDREEIWSNFFQKLADEKDQDPDLDIDVKGLMSSTQSLAQHKINGRQIRNSIRTARQLALFEQETFSASHIRDCIKVVKEFEKYVEETQGESSTKRAELSGIRKNPESS